MTSPGHSAAINLGVRQVSYSPQQTLLYAVAIGATPEDLDLVYEKRAVAALPTWAAALGLWVTEAAASALGYDRSNNLHIGQVLTVHRPLPVGATLAIEGSVVGVVPKGDAAIVRVRASCEEFTAEYVMWIPGFGARASGLGTPAPRTALADYAPSTRTRVPVREDVAILYRLTGDDHPVHVDPAVARAAGNPRPIMHGLCTLGLTTLAVAKAQGFNSLELTGVVANWTRPAFPGTALDVAAGVSPQGVRFTTSQDGELVCEGFINPGQKFQL